VLDEIESLIARIQANGDEVWIAGPQSDEAISALERAMGVPMPPSYRSFLRRYGGLGVFDSYISGIIDNAIGGGAGRLLDDTERFRRDYGLPPHLLVVQKDHDAPYCLDCQMPDARGEYPLVCYELHSGCQTRLNASFGEWLLIWLQLRADLEADE